MMVTAALLALALANGGQHSAPPAHAAPPPAHAAPPHVAPAPPHVAPAPPHAAPAPRPAGGFNLPHDISRPVSRPPLSMPHYQARPPAHGRPVANPHRWGSWQWNNGVAWSPASAYWGGGFWGPWAIGLAIGSYFVQPETPGAELLAEYGLTQTPCGPPNLVEIFGPDGSEICAYPNDLVGPGQYQVDPQTLTLISY